MILVQWFVWVVFGFVVSVFEASADRILIR